MDDQSTRIKELFLAYQDNIATETEVQELLELLSSGTSEEDVLLLMQQQLTHSEELGVDQGRYEQILLKIRAESGMGRGRIVRLLPRIGIAAAVTVVLFGAGLMVYQMNNGDKVVNVAQVNDVAPGRQSATLTLADGRKIRLADASNGKLAQEGGVVISKDAAGRIVYEIKEKDNSNKVNTISTANGETYQLRLPDGSHVWLNAASTLSYSAALIKDGMRRVALKGEGYFEVAKDKLHPFIVSTAGQEVEVLGTQFNVNSYADEAGTATTLIEGSVKVRAGGENRVIKPGQQSLNVNGGLKVATVNTESITDWKDGDFNLDDVDFREAMRKVSRWYDVEMVCDAAVPLHFKAGGLVSRNQKLSAVLDMIQRLGIVEFKISGRKVYVYKTVVKS
ncbi:anti-sigma factor [Pedobacter sp. KBW01]|uniref:FecR family protein n=1 Tax=Pedobacter sp. KBW01 TaxID=2153364 RepID=UPI000F5A4102|nr:FecR family protein [Pedobacter sp. KBW01]RQO77776.1 anti-sigma factor [Pedobacter sp. KBW01]